MAEPPPTYTRDEMDAILKRAIERQQAKSEEIAHEDLVAAAGEVGIPREEVEAAARDVAAEKAERGAAAPAVAPAAIPTLDDGRARAVQRLRQRAITFFALSMFFFFIGRETGAGWWIWPVFGMGISLIIQASRVLFGDPGARDDGRPARRRSRHEEHLTWRRQRELSREERIADFERKVAIGADALVRVIDEARSARGRPGEARPAPRETRPRVNVTPPPGVRVEPREADAIEQGAGRETEEGERNRQSVK
jgi:hypothetical protein